MGRVYRRRHGGNCGCYGCLKSAAGGVMPGESSISYTPSNLPQPVLPLIPGLPSYVDNCCLEPRPGQYGRCRLSSNCIGPLPMMPQKEYKYTQTPFPYRDMAKLGPSEGSGFFDDVWEGFKHGATIARGPLQFLAGLPVIGDVAGPISHVVNFIPGSKYDYPSHQYDDSGNARDAYDDYYHSGRGFKQKGKRGKRAGGRAPMFGRSPAFARLARSIYQEYLRKGYAPQQALYIAKATAGRVARNRGGNLWGDIKAFAKRHHVALGAAAAALATAVPALYLASQGNPVPLEIRQRRAGAHGAFILN